MPILRGKFSAGYYEPNLVADDGKSYALTGNSYALINGQEVLIIGHTEHEHGHGSSESYTKYQVLDKESLTLLAADLNWMKKELIFEIDSKNLRQIS